MTTSFKKKNGYLDTKVCEHSKRFSHLVTTCFRELTYVIHFHIFMHIKQEREIVLFNNVLWSIPSVQLYCTKMAIIKKKGKFSHSHFITIRTSKKLHSSRNYVVMNRNLDVQIQRMWEHACNVLLTGNLLIIPIIIIMLIYIVQSCYVIVFLLKIT